MLSYRHAFHAGNHADVLKHWLLVQCLQYLKRKEKPFLYLDTHAGAGAYSLVEEFAQATGEYQRGIARLWQQSDVPAALQEYLQVIRNFNHGELIRYPGSALIAARLLREQDQLCATELHPNDQQLLRQNLARNKRARVIAEDGFQQLKALLPPPSRRALVLIDPPYERDEEYKRVLQSLKEGLKRFATGSYLVWYPLLNKASSQQFPQQLRALKNIEWLDVQLQVQARPRGAGMYGSGMFIINPPYTLQGELEQTLPWLSRELAVEGQGQYHIHSNNTD